MELAALGWQHYKPRACISVEVEFGAQTSDQTLTKYDVPSEGNPIWTPAAELPGPKLKNCEHGIKGHGVN
jgi:hypothetical protein